MKVLNLVCGDGHAFEGWFRHDDDYQQQVAGGLLSCPVCGQHDIRKTLSAPRLNLGAAHREPQAETKPDTGGREPSLQRELRALIQHMVESTEDVGRRFAEEARKMHYDEVPERPIRGLATRQEAQELKEEGIQVLSLPIAQVDKEKLQ